MEYRQLGRSGLRVSKICLGTMVGFARKDQKVVARVVDEALDNGINFIDSADCYHEAETTLGRILPKGGRRDKVVLATKFGWYMGGGPNDYGASRYHIVKACEESLRKLRTDHIDLYILHVVDANTRWEEVLGAIDLLVRQGKVLYFGTSKHPSVLILEALFTSERYGLPRVVSEQPAYSLLDRMAENELIPTCIRHGVGITPFYPLASGLLSGRYSLGKEAPKGSRFANRKLDANPAIVASLQAVEKLRPIADARGLTVAELSLAWLMQQPGVTAPIVGMRTPEYLRSGVKACKVTLTQEELQKIDEIVPPGTYVYNTFEASCYRPLRFGFSSAARLAGAGAFIPDNKTGSDAETGYKQQAKKK